jgi:hypothetical protein
VLPSTVSIRDGVVQLVSYLGGEKSGRTTNGLLAVAMACFSSTTWYIIELFNSRRLSMDLSAKYRSVSRSRHSVTFP